MVSLMNARRITLWLWKRALHGGALERVRVVLVSPQHAGNVGSVCRVATNFDCNELWLVNPQCDFRGVEAQTMAANVTSRSKLEHIRVTDTLPEALKDCSMVDDRLLDSLVAVEYCASLTHGLPISASHL